MRWTNWGNIAVSCLLLLSQSPLGFDEGFCLHLAQEWNMKNSMYIRKHMCISSYFQPRICKVEITTILPLGVDFSPPLVLARLAQQQRQTTHCLDTMMGEKENIWGRALVTVRVQGTLSSIGSIATSNPVWDKLNIIITHISHRRTFTFFFGQALAGFGRMMLRRVFATWDVWTLPWKGMFVSFIALRMRLYCQLRNRCLGVPVHRFSPIPSCKTHQAEKGVRFLKTWQIETLMNATQHCEHARTRAENFVQTKIITSPFLAFTSRFPFRKRVLGFFI